MQTRAEIDGLLARWGIKDSHWHWDPEHNQVFLQFKLSETIENVPVSSVIKVEAPAIWDKKTRNRVEELNWRLSLRVLWWFLKSHLEAAYLRQSDKTTAFLPYISSADGSKTLRDVIIPRLSKQGIPELDILPEQEVSKDKVVDAEIIEEK